MTIYTRPDDLIFASEAKPGETTTFPDIPRGWGVTEKSNFIPPMEYFNAAFQRIDKAIAYLLQRGVAEWSPTIEYPAQAVTIKAGQVFFALQQNTNKDPFANPNVWVNSFAQKANQSDFYSLKNAMIGIPWPYPLEIVPVDHLAMNGQRFNTRTYPELAKKYPSGILPDIRGMVIRGLDNGRGYDVGRIILSGQYDAIQTHGHYMTKAFGGKRVILNNSKGKGEGRSYLAGSYEEDGTAGGAIYEASPGYHPDGRFAIETRMKNIAFHYICLAR